MYIVAFNGPPRSGKDTLAAMVVDAMERQIDFAPAIFLESLSNPLRSIACAMVNRLYSAESYEAFKEEYFERLDRTGRQLMIDASESFLKPTYGQTIMADLLIQRVRGYPQNSLVLVRDSGFQVEVDPLIQEFGSDNVLVVQVHRQGCDFQNDSREWVWHPDGKNQMYISNSGSLEFLRNGADRFPAVFQNKLGWKF